jgi:hypothetical protein
MPNKDPEEAEEFLTDALHLSDFWNEVDFFATIMMCAYLIAMPFEPVSRVHMCVSHSSAFCGACVQSRHLIWTQAGAAISPRMSCISPTALIHYGGLHLNRQAGVAAFGFEAVAGREV